MSQNTTMRPPGPRIEPGTGQLPSAVTFFLTRAQRRALLKVLKVLGDDRSAALLTALGLDDNATNEIAHD